ncbi:hypothetical protein H6F76_25135 [Leptolyngbya sp. FACHB-321]|uniref:hypothetical protein n=1 Tax=Leptolyngbya sp. FACHB-321 TaxID=2692807 RepID=UPI001682FBF8|nr:hypothetical protein [Leptolyngbya sp. FACHB-321]MBD2038241.1 hypothetical protein [Leptolyngbya sp. FACHB-321]
MSVPLKRSGYQRQLYNLPAGKWYQGRASRRVLKPQQRGDRLWLLGCLDQETMRHRERTASGRTATAFEGVLVALD